MKGLAIGALAGMIVMTGPVAVHAQTIPTPDPPSNPGLKVGPVALAPTVRLSEFGYDSNVYNLSNDAHPLGDVVSTLSPSVNAWFRFAHLRVSTHSQFDFYYYKTLPDLRAVDSDNAAQVDLIVNRTRLFVVAGRVDTQRRQTLEIDAIAQRQNDFVTLGTEVRVTGKTSLAASVTRSSLEYAPNSLYLGTDLGSVLNFKSSVESVGLRYAATPLTKFAVDVTHAMARFETATERNSADFSIIPSVEFSPFALISGRAAVGVITRTFENGSPSFSGSTAFVDLSYILLGRTRFAVSANRRLEYSYLPGLHDYILTGVALSVTQRVAEAWDVGGNIGPSRINYRQSTVTTVGAPQTPEPLLDERVLTYGVDLGYNVKHTRIGFYTQHIQRDGDQTSSIDRGYQRFRIGSTVKYDF